VSTEIMLRHLTARARKSLKEQQGVVVDEDLVEKARMMRQKDSWVLHLQLLIWMGPLIHPTVEELTFAQELRHSQVNQAIPVVVVLVAPSFASLRLAVAAVAVG